MRRATTLMTGAGFVLMSWAAWPVISPPAAPVAQRMLEAAAGSFDGTWNVVLDCPTDPSPGGALHYTYQFPAQVSGGVFRGEHGAPGAPGWLLFEGTIQPDGSAVLVAKGLTGQPPYTLRQLSGGTPYGYRMTAHFQGGRGNGTRTDGRTCTAAFTKQ
jgi:hypothetical protein